VTHEIHAVGTVAAVLAPPDGAATP